MKSKTARSVVWVLTLLVTLAGAWISFKLTAQHLRVVKSDSSFLDDVCTAFATSSCEEVIQSDWGAVNLGLFVDDQGKPIRVPTAQLGLVFFTFMACWLVLVGPVSSQRWWLHLLICLFAAVSLGFCIFLAWVMYTTLPTWCPLCAATHLASAVIFVGLLLIWPRRATRAATPPSAGTVPAASASDSLFPSSADPDLDDPPPAIAPTDPPRPVVQRAPWPGPYALAVTAMVTILVVTTQTMYLSNLRTQAELKVADYYKKYWLKRYRRYDDHWQITYWAWRISPAVPLDLQNEPIRGPVDAKHTIVVFSDFQCPTCARLADVMEERIKPMAARHGGYRLVFKHYPICTECNPEAKRNLHPKACIAARAAEAARLIGGNDGFWQMHDLLFSHRDGIKTADEDWFVERGMELGFDANAFRDAMNSPAVLERIHRNIQEAVTLGEGVVDEDELDETKVSATPAVFIDNRQLRSWRHMQTWRMILAKPPLPTGLNNTDASDPEHQDTPPGQPPARQGTRRPPVEPPEEG